MIEILHSSWINLVIPLNSFKPTSYVDVKLSSLNPVLQSHLNLTHIKLVLKQNSCFLKHNTCFPVVLSMEHDKHAKTAGYGWVIE